MEILRKGNDTLVDIPFGHECSVKVYYCWDDHGHGDVEARLNCQFSAGNGKILSAGNGRIHYAEIDMEACGIWLKFKEKDMLKLKHVCELRNNYELFDIVQRIKHKKELEVNFKADIAKQDLEISKLLSPELKELL